jgi:hypothetical protein
VVELQGKNPGPGAVQILLQGEGPRPVPRNVTLVLKARRPTRWQLGSHGIDGSIVVVVSFFLYTLRNSHILQGFRNQLLHYIQKRIAKSSHNWLNTGCMCLMRLSTVSGHIITIHWICELLFVALVL